MGQCVAKSKGMDKLDRLILEADPNADKAKMLLHREYAELIGCERYIRELQKQRDNKKIQRIERADLLYREKQERAARIAAAKTSKAAIDKPIKTIYLRKKAAPLPACFLRCALFGIRKYEDKPRLHHEEYQDIPLYAPKDWTIRWSGFELDQLDLDVFAQLVKRAAEVSPEFLNGKLIKDDYICVKFRRNELLISMGKSKGGTNRKNLDKSITYLRGCDVQVEDASGKKRYSSKLLGRRSEDDDSDMEIIEIDARLANLLGRGLTQIDVKSRAKLGKDQTAKWLHGFFSSHKGPTYSVSLSLLRDICKPESSPSEFNRLVKNALPKLDDILASSIIERNGYERLLRVVYK